MTMPAEMKSDIALVIDDSPETLSLLTDSLEESGVSVLVARDGEAALRLVKRITPDVILLDAVMPGLDGFETCRRIKRDRALAHVPVIFMTGLSETESVVEGLRAGGVDYLTKPIAPDELIARIGVHLANARLWQSTRSAFDAAGRSLVAVSSGGRLLWSSPKASRLLSDASLLSADGERIESEEIVGWLESVADKAASTISARELKELHAGGLRIEFVTRSSPDELLVHVTEASDLPNEARLSDRLGLTMREAEVLNWISQGKSNRDIGEILSLSPRTVNKHLEQIYSKLGVENRTAAAAVAIRTLL